MNRRQAIGSIAGAVAVTAVATRTSEAKTAPLTPVAAGAQPNRCSRCRNARTDRQRRDSGRPGGTHVRHDRPGVHADLSLSLYPVKDFHLDAERNELGELAGDPTAASFAPSYEKFDVPDEEHVTKASRDLSLVQAAGMNLRSAVVKAQAKFPGGFIYWAIPTRQGTRAGYGIYVLDAQNHGHYLFVS